MSLEAIKYTRGELRILDQLKLPHRSEYMRISKCDDGYFAIRNMVVRGAPAIAIVAALSLAVELHSLKDKLSGYSLKGIQKYIETALDRLNSSRPTAVNLSDAVTKLKAAVGEEVVRDGSTVQSVIETYITRAEDMLSQDVTDNKNIGKFGSTWLVNAVEGKNKISVLTHCNTGSLATAGYGTALGIIRSLWASGSLAHAYCTETRPYNQGSRLTAYELVHEKIPATLITDSMAASVMHLKGVDAIVVGADRVVANGDTANKIGTYQLAILAKYHGVKFVVAAPTTSIDMATSCGREIHIEQRGWHEVVKIAGPKVNKIEADRLVLDLNDVCTVSTAAHDIGVYNPSFDVTPAELIDAIVTEKGVAVKDAEGKFHLGALTTGSN
ncbi:Methylthioribose-1-phosphate isomerase [Kalaharituber pfeilii]|nr:Methylthioribose-1-phosphate isomerase [Kalaharituber pfeilii]